MAEFLFNRTANERANFLRKNGWEQGELFIRDVADAMLTFEDVRDDWFDYVANTEEALLDSWNAEWDIYDISVQRTLLIGA